jgi:hypothetical protein
VLADHEARLPAQPRADGAKCECPCHAGGAPMHAWLGFDCECERKAQPAPEGLPKVGTRTHGVLSEVCKDIDAWWAEEGDKDRFVRLRNCLAGIVTCIEAQARVAQPEPSKESK